MINTEKQKYIRVNINILSSVVLNISEGFCDAPGKSEMVLKGCSWGVYVFERYRTFRDNAQSADLLSLGA